MLFAPVRVHCLSDCCWFSCRCYDDRGRGPYWLFASAADEAAFHGVPFQAVLCRGEPSRVVHVIVAVSVNFGWLLVQVDVVFPSLDWSSLLTTFSLVGVAGF